MKFRSEKNIIQRKQKSGLYTFLVRIRTEDGEVSKSFNEADYPTAKIAFDSAVRYRNQMQYELSMGLVEKKNNSTVQQMFDTYIDTCPSSLKTKNHLRKLFNKYVQHKDIKIQELTKADIIEDLNRMVEIASDDTIQRVMYIYRTCIVGTALLKNILLRDITLGVPKPKSKMAMQKRGVTTDKKTMEIVKKGVLGSVRSLYDAQIICFLLDVLYYTGMRPAEAEVLERTDISKTHISVTKQLGSSTDEDNVPTNTKAAESVRLIPIHPDLRPILDDLLDFAKTERLFAKEDGHYMDSSWIGTIINRVAKNKGVEFNLYRLRHNVATELVTNNVDSRTTTELLGHARYNMSLYYARSNDELKEEAIELIQIGRASCRERV